MQAQPLSQQHQQNHQQQQYIPQDQNLVRIHQAVVVAIESAKATANTALYVVTIENSELQRKLREKEEEAERYRFVFSLLIVMAR